MKINPSISVAAAMTAALAPIASAQNTFYNPGDLVLYFQQENGSNTVYANLGPATGFRGAAAGPDVANSINFRDLNSVLTSAFGAGWASDPTVYAGLAGLFSASGTSTAVTNGDPARTLYVSASRDNAGTVGLAGSAGYSVVTNTGMTTGSNGIFNQNNLFEVTYDAQAVVSPTGISFIDDQNTFLGPGIQGAAFGIFASGVQQKGTAGSFGSFGAAGNVEFALDLYRILAREGASGQVAGTGTVREGTFEGTITVNSSGLVSFIGQGSATSPFQTWALTFPALDTEAKRLPDADPDFDGLNNLMEFVLNGNPGVSDNATINPALDASGENFIFSFSRRDDSVAGSTLVFQHGSDLSGWTDVAIGGSSNLPTVEVQQGTPADAITVTIPKAPGGKLFGRLKVTQP